MQPLHFAILPYRSSNNVINPDYVYLALVDESGDRIESDSIRKDAWHDNEDVRAYWKRTLISRIYKKCENYSSWHAEYKLPDDIYEDFRKWYFFIDGEDAQEFIIACGHSQHSHNFQSRCGVTIGWKYFKVLKEHQFQTSTAAMLAYTRGYLAGMDLNAPWDREGSEALACLGLTTEADKHLTE